MKMSSFTLSESFPMADTMCKYGKKRVPDLGPYQRHVPFILSLIGVNQQL